MERESRVRFWAEHIEVWKSSGLSQRAYCAREGIAVSTLQWWCRRLREHGHGDTPRLSCFGSPIIEAKQLHQRRSSGHRPRIEPTL